MKAVIAVIAGMIISALVTIALYALVFVALLKYITGE